MRKRGVPLEMNEQCVSCTSALTNLNPSGTGGRKLYIFTRLLALAIPFNRPQLEPATIGETNLASGSSFNTLSLQLSTQLEAPLAPCQAFTSKKNARKKPSTGNPTGAVRLPLENDISASAQPIVDDINIRGGNNHDLRRRRLKTRRQNHNMVNPIAGAQPQTLTCWKNQSKLVRKHPSWHAKYRAEDLEYHKQLECA